MDQSEGKVPDAKGGSRRRRLLGYAAYLIFLGVLCVTSLFGGIYGHVKWSEANRVDVVPVFRKYRIVRKIFTNQAAVDLYMSVKKIDKFESTWDFDNGILLSKELFVPTEMYGEMKYRYRPNIDVYNLAIWSGLQVLNVGHIAGNPKVEALLSECTVLRQSHYKTDANGFKPTGFPVQSGQPTCFFLGDSFTEGLWVAPEETFASLMGHKFVDADINLAPVNLGVNGYSTLEMSWMLEQYAPQFNPAAVVVNLFPNDVHANFVDVVRGEGVPEENYQRMFRNLDRMRRICDDIDARLVHRRHPCALSGGNEGNDWAIGVSGAG